MYGLASAGNGHGGAVCASVTPDGVSKGTVAIDGLWAADAPNGEAALTTRLLAATRIAANATTVRRAFPWTCLVCAASGLMGGQSRERTCKVVISGGATPAARRDGR